MSLTEPYCLLNHIGRTYQGSAFHNNICIEWFPVEDPLPAQAHYHPSRLKTSISFDWITVTVKLPAYPYTKKSKSFTRAKRGHDHGRGEDPG